MSEIRIVGAGLLGAAHFTVQSIEALRDCAVVFHLINGMDLVAALHAMHPQVVSLVPLYTDGALDLDVYQRITATVLHAAAVHGTVALVVMGHPSIYVAPTHLIRRSAPPEIAVRIYPALSSIDVILTMMPFDIGSSGLQILDANRLVAYGLVPLREVPLLVFQIGCFGSGFITRTVENQANRLEILANYLARTYPADHTVFLLECQMGIPHREVRIALTLRELGQAGTLVNYNSTLYVPPCEPLRVRDPEFQASLVDPHRVTALVR